MSKYKKIWPFSESQCHCDDIFFRVVQNEQQLLFACKNADISIIKFLLKHYEDKDLEFDYGAVFSTIAYFGAKASSSHISYRSKTEDLTNRIYCLEFLGNYYIKQIKGSYIYLEIANTLKQNQIKTKTTLEVFVREKLLKAFEEASDHFPIYRENILSSYTKHVCTCLFENQSIELDIEQIMKKQEKKTPAEFEDNEFLESELESWEVALRDEYLKNRSNNNKEVLEESSEEECIWLYKEDRSKGWENDCERKVVFADKKEKSMRKKSYSTTDTPDSTLLDEKGAFEVLSEGNIGIKVSDPDIGPDRESYGDEY